ncbi:MAG TPA: MBOAT family O-acyltransferase [Puia sp.]|jgi:D-alanyl-lipoteichoic acid acyltransferase DltB (MBOAT superfamily)
MPLHSFEFILFLSLVFILYWSLFKNSARAQNTLLTAASLFFYGWADWRFLSLLVFSVLFNFYTGKAIRRSATKTRQYLLYLGLAVNIGILFYFKYFHFFYGSFLRFFNGYEPDARYGALNIILPLGISFFTFQAIGYLVDLYKEEMEPAPGLLSFATYMTYFPKMTAGPIERAENFLPRIAVRREFNRTRTVDGLRQILWGSFTKLVIANNCATFTTPVFDNYDHLSGSTLLLGAFFYLFQVYCDFSGYSNIAIGISKLFGIDLMRNFAAPFFSTNIRDYWKKWHISLSSWMMHYVFTPISFTLRRYHKTGLILSIIITFLVIGLWHGANWTFILFGLLHGLYFIPLILASKPISRTTSGQNPASAPAKKAHPGPSPRQGLQMLGLFILVMLTLIVFGADSVSQAIHYIGRLFSPSLFSKPSFPVEQGIGGTKTLLTILFILALMTVEWIQKNKNHEMQIDDIKHPALRIGIYYTLILAILLFGSVVHIYFMYAQF